MTMAIGVTFIAILIFMSIVLFLSGQEKESGAVNVMPPPAFDLVEMNVSAYCVCEKCCGRFADGITASGKPAVGLICAAPPEYPFGTEFEVDGVVYVVEDRGGAITGDRLDLLFPTHEEALEFGRQILKVRIEK